MYKTPVITAVIVGWSIIYTLYTTLVSLLVIGPNDFNGSLTHSRQILLGQYYLRQA